MPATSPHVCALPDPPPPEMPWECPECGLLWWREESRCPTCERPYGEPVWLRQVATVGTSDARVLYEPFVARTP